LSYLTDLDAEAYIKDMQIAQRYACANRELMCQNILEYFSKRMDIKSIQENEIFQTVHNYISQKDNIIRKGAISAYKDEKVLIPMNMKDGCIIGIGKGNEEWNFSAPHGAGRVMSRSEAKSKLSIDEFRKEMRNVYSSTVNEGTIDESPMAYKPMEEIISVIGETIEIVSIIKPIYNVKAIEEEPVWKRNKQTSQNIQ
jgi:RNA-splicing ligase RtcB